MSHKNHWIYAVKLCMLLGAISCMDVTPPSGAHQQSSLLHSIKLPFNVAVYGVGDEDSLMVRALLVTGEEVEIDPQTIEWIYPLQSAVSINDVGRLKAHASFSGRMTLIARYEVEQVTRADTSYIYVTPNSYNIETFRIISLDSSRAGQLITASLFLEQGVSSLNPQYRIEIEDADNRDLDGLPPLSDFIGYFNRNVSFGTIDHEGTIRLNLRGTPSVSMIGVREVPYWLGIEAYMYGKLLRDSVVFQPLPPAETGWFAMSDPSNASIQMFGSDGFVLQPCAYLMGSNATADTLVVELSGESPSQVCNGRLPSADTTFILPPNFSGIIRQAGYPPGVTIRWKMTSKNNPTLFQEGDLIF